MKNTKDILKIGETGSLSDLITGQYAQILKVNLEKGVIRKRLFEMGVEKGVLVKIKKASPTGDPMQIELRGYQLGISRSVMKQIDVVVIDENKYYGKGLEE